MSSHRHETVTAETGACRHLEGTDTRERRGHAATSLETRHLVNVTYDLFSSIKSSAVDLAGRRELHVNVQRNERGKGRVCGEEGVFVCLCVEGRAFL